MFGRDNPDWELFSRNFLVDGHGGALWRNKRDQTLWRWRKVDFRVPSGSRVDAGKFIRSAEGLKLIADEMVA